MASGNHFLCVDVKIYNENNTICGITKSWQRRFSENTSFGICAVPSVIAWKITLFVIYYINRHLPVIYKRSLSKDKKEASKKRKNRRSQQLSLTRQEALEEDEGCDSEEENFSENNSVQCSLKNCYLMCTVIISTYVKIVWEAIDVTIDAYLFYLLETGKVIDKDIYRNRYVNDAIIIFSGLGCLKIFFWMRIIGVGAKTGLKDLSPRTLSVLKLYFVAGTFIFEDGPEIIVEYFYVEKYLTIQPAWYLLARDIVLCVISLYHLVESSCFLVGDFFRSRNRIYKLAISNICNVIIGVVLSLRVGGACYQYFTGKLRGSCLTLDNGVLIQTPFTCRCMREVDYFIIVLNGFAIICSFFVFIIVNNLLTNLHGDQNIELPF